MSKESKVLLAYMLENGCTAEEAGVILGIEVTEDAKTNEKLIKALYYRELMGSYSVYEKEV